MVRLNPGAAVSVLTRLILFLRRPCLFSRSGMCYFVGNTLLEIQFFTMKNIWHFTEFFECSVSVNFHFSEDWSPHWPHCQWDPHKADVPARYQALWLALCALLLFNHPKTSTASVLLLTSHSWGDHDVKSWQSFVQCRTSQTEQRPVLNSGLFNTPTPVLALFPLTLRPCSVSSVLNAVRNSCTFRIVTCSCLFIHVSQKCSLKSVSW